ncbi:MAG: hypothetical protein ACI8QZ_002677 [Chlamydiales bacterium]|jgi:hypothetical protein
MSPRAPHEALTESEIRAWRRMQAGILVERGLADRREARRWQEAVQRGEFDPDACARDIVGNSDVDADDARVIDRTARLQRDLLMTPLQHGARGAGRRMRGATRGGVAFLLSQVMALVVYTLVLLIIVLLARMQRGFSLDGMLDTVLEVVTPGSEAPDPDVPATEELPLEGEGG